MHKAGTLAALLTIAGSLTLNCGNKAERARRELAEMDIKYDAQTFMKTIENGDSLAVKLFLQAGMSPESEGKSGADVPGRGFVQQEFTALNLAIYRGHIDIAYLLLEFGADPNKRTRDGTSLHYALGSPLIPLKQRLDFISNLLLGGVDVNAPSNRGVLPLDIAKGVLENPDIIKLLEERGAKTSGKIVR